MEPKVAEIEVKHRDTKSNRQVSIISVGCISTKYEHLKEDDQAV